jgi:hypothetical protein
MERARLQARLGGGEGSVSPSGRVAGQRNGTLQERSRRGEAAARLRPAGRALELQGDLLVRSRRSHSQMPRTTVWIDLPIGCLGQRQMNGPAFRH